MAVSFLPTKARLAAVPAAGPTADRVTGEGRSAAGRADRDASLDNVRFCAAAFIVVGHLVLPLVERSAIAEHFWYGSWFIRIPVLVLLAGYFSSAAPMVGTRMVALLRNVLFVYLVFDLIGTVIQLPLGGRWSYDPASPPIGMWFLLALFIWRVLLPYLTQIRGVVALAFAVSVAAGAVESLTGTQYAIGRAIALLPFFVLGWKVRQFGKDRLAALRFVRPAAAVLLTVVVVGGTLFASRMPRWWLTMKRGYGNGTMAELLQLGLIRLVILLVTAAAVVAVLVLAPRRRIPVLTYLGSGTMYVYVLHLPVITVLSSTDFFDHFDSRVEVLALMAGGLLLAAALASAPTRALTRWLVQPKFTWPFRTSAEQPRLHAASRGGQPLNRLPVPAPRVEPRLVAAAG